MGDKENDDDDDGDDDDDHDVKLPSTNGQRKDADGEPPVLKMSILKKRYKGWLKRLLEEKHAVIIDKKKQAWLSPWKLATMIHCLDTNQDYSLITKRPGPTLKEIEAHVFQQGMHDEYKRESTNGKVGVETQAQAPLQAASGKDSRGASGQAAKSSCIVQIRLARTVHCDSRVDFEHSAHTKVCLQGAAANFGFEGSVECSSSYSTSSRVHW